MANTGFLASLPMDDWSMHPNSDIMSIISDISHDDQPLQPHHAIVPFYPNASNQSISSFNPSSVSRQGNNFKLAVANPDLAGDIGTIGALDTSDSTFPHQLVASSAAPVKVKTASSNIDFDFFPCPGLDIGDSFTGEDNFNDITSFFENNHVDQVSQNYLRPSSNTDNNINNTSNSQNSDINNTSNFNINNNSDALMKEEGLKSFNIEINDTKLDASKNAETIVNVDYIINESLKSEGFEMDFLDTAFTFNANSSIGNNPKIPILSARDNSCRVHKRNYSKPKHQHQHHHQQHVNTNEPKPADEWLSFESVLDDALSELNGGKVGGSTNSNWKKEPYDTSEFDFSNMSFIDKFDSHIETLGTMDTQYLSSSSSSSTSSVLHLDQLISDDPIALPDTKLLDNLTEAAQDSTWHAPCKTYSRVGSPHRCFYYTHVLSRIIHLLKSPQDPSVITKLAVLSLVCEYLIKDAKLTKSEAACKARLMFMNNQFDSNVASISAAAVAALEAGQNEAKVSAISLGEVLESEVVDAMESEASNTAGFDGISNINGVNGINSFSGIADNHHPSSSSLQSSSSDTCLSSKVRQKKAKMGNETILRWLDHLETKGSLETDHRGRHRKRSPVLSEHEKEFLKQVFEFLPCDKRSAKAVRVLASSMKNDELLKQLAGNSASVVVNGDVSSYDSGALEMLSQTGNDFSQEVSMVPTNGVGTINNNNNNNISMSMSSTSLSSSLSQDSPVFSQSLAKMLAAHYAINGINVSDKLKISHATAFGLIGKWGYKSKGHGKKTWYELE